MVWKQNSSLLILQHCPVCLCVGCPTKKNVKAVSPQMVSYSLDPMHVRVLGPAQAAQESCD